MPFPALLLNSRATLGGPCRGAEWSGAGAEWSGVERTKRTKRTKRSGAEPSGAERSGAERGAERSGVERSQAEPSGAERSQAEPSGAERSQAESKVWRLPTSMLPLAGTGSACCISLPDAGGTLQVNMVAVRDDTGQHGSGSGRYGQHGSGSGRYRSTW